MPYPWEDPQYQQSKDIANQLAGMLFGPNSEFMQKYMGATQGFGGHGYRPGIGKLQELTTYNIEPIFQKLLSNQYKPGGFLSETPTSLAFSSLSRAAQQRSRMQQQEMFRSAAASGMSPGFARLLGSAIPFESARDLMGQRAGLQSQLAENRFGAQQAFSNALAANEVAQKQDFLGSLLDVESLIANEQVGKATARAHRSAGLFGALGELGGAAIGAGACCFIMLEARYGDGTMDEVVRRYRDEKMTPRNRRGYYKLAEVFVPLMRRSRLFKGLVRLTMTSPMVSYGKWYYGRGRIGWIFSPLVKGWLRLFDVLGGDTEFIRENGEVV